METLKNNDVSYFQICSYFEKSNENFASNGSIIYFKVIENAGKITTIIFILIYF